MFGSLQTYFSIFREYWIFAEQKVNFFPMENLLCSLTNTSKGPFADADDLNPHQYFHIDVEFSYATVRVYRRE